MPVMCPNHALQPLYYTVTTKQYYTVLDVLRVSLENQRDILRGLPRRRFLLLAVVNLLPLALVGIRWSGTKAS